MGMPVGVQVPEPQPTAIVTARMGTTMPGGVKHTRAAMGRRHGSGAERRGGFGLRRLVCTGGTAGFWRQTLEGFGRGGAFALARRGDWLR